MDICSGAQNPNKNGCYISYMPFFSGRGNVLVMLSSAGILDMCVWVDANDLMIREKYGSPADDRHSRAIYTCNELATRGKNFFPPKHGQ